jgi:signal-transduction protein with cAMP-binding, CBS, and nucleotidyltransferase domain
VPQSSDELVADYIQKPILVGLGESAKNTTRIMAANGSSCAVVTINEQAVGIVTEWDVLTRLVILGKDASNTPVSEIMSAPIWTVEPSTSVGDAVSLMMGKRFRRLVVVDERKKVFGVISLSEIIGNRRESSILLPLLEPSRGSATCPFCRQALNSKEEAMEHISRIGCKR